MLKVLIPDCQQQWLIQQDLVVRWPIFMVMMAVQMTHNPQLIRELNRHHLITARLRRVWQCRHFDCKCNCRVWLPDKAVQLVVVSRTAGITLLYVLYILVLQALFVCLLNNVMILTAHLHTVIDVSDKVGPAQVTRPLYWSHLRTKSKLVLSLILSVCLCNMRVIVSLHTDVLP